MSAKVVALAAGRKDNSHKEWMTDRGRKTTVSIGA
jgi:hypothetical protein